MRASGPAYEHLPLPMTRQLARIVAVLLIGAGVPMMAGCSKLSDDETAQKLAVADMPPASSASSKPVAQESYPRVIDKANVIPPEQEARITAMLAGLQAKSGHELVVATVADMDGQTMNEYSLRLARSLKIGRPDYSDGALLTLAPNDRRVRVELGYGLECRISDARGQKILDDMNVHFDKKDYATGLEVGAAHMVRELEAVPNDTREWARKAKEKGLADPCDSQTAA